MRSKTRDALRESQRQLEILLDNLPGMAYRCKNIPSWTMEFVSSGCIRLTGYAPKELVADRRIAYGDVIHPDDRQRVWEAIQSEIAGGQSFQVTYRITTSTGESKWVWEQGQAIANAAGEAEVLEGFISDITARMQASEALRQSELRFRSIFNQTYQLAGILSLDGTLLAANQTSLDFVGVSEAEVIGRPFWDTPWWVHSDELRAWLRSAVAEAALGNVKQRMVTHVDSDGRMHHLDFSLTPALDDARNVAYLIPESRDITEYRLAEEALRESERKFSTITENSADAIFVLTRAGTCTYANKAACSLLGYSSRELLSMTMAGLLPDRQGPAGMEMLQRLFDIGHGYSELELLHKDGHVIPVDFNTVLLPNGLAYASCRDLTARRELEQGRLQLEAQLRQAQKLESIGTLASGIAHEVNNPLMGMINYAELIKDRVEEDEQVLEYSKSIIVEGNRIATIVRNLLSFARQDEAVSSPANIADIIASALSLLHASLRMHQIQVSLEIAEELPLVTCRSQQIQQVIVNLLTNAQAALDKRYSEYDESKMLTIRAEVHDNNGLWLRVTVEDRGSGIPEEFQDRIFDPFFTSKTRDQGTGLGLSVSHGIIADHGGHLTFETQEGEFTRFFVDLPLSFDGRPELS